MVDAVVQEAKAFVEAEKVALDGMRKTTEQAASAEVRSAQACVSPVARSHRGDFLLSRSRA